MIDQITDLKKKMASHLVSFQDSLCQTLDVLDQRYYGNAKSILLRDESAGGRAGVQNLDAIGETPNPDDEETFRQ